MSDPILYISDPGLEPFQRIGIQPGGGPAVADTNIALADNAQRDIDSLIAQMEAKGLHEFVPTVRRTLERNAQTAASESARILREHGLGRHTGNGTDPVTDDSGLSDEQKTIARLTKLAKEMRR